MFTQQAYKMYKPLGVTDTGQAYLPISKDNNPSGVDSLRTMLLLQKISNPLSPNDVSGIENRLLATKRLSFINRISVL